MWPWKPVLAYFLTLLLLVVLLGGLILASQTTDWPGDALEPWAYLAAVLVALIPLILVFVDYVADRRGSVSFLKYISLDFRASEAVTARRIALNPNIVGDAPIQDSAREEMRSTLLAATHTEIVELDLGRGDAWWSTRLLILASGAARRGKPMAISFLADADGRRRVFQGWARPDEVRDQLLARDPSLRVAYGTMQRKLHQLLTNPQLPDAWQVWGPPPPGATIDQPDAHVLNELGPEMLLVEAVIPLEPPDHGLTAGDLQATLGPVLHTATLDLSSDESALIDVALAVPDAYIAITRDGLYQGLAEMSAIERDILRSIFLHDSRR